MRATIAYTCARILLLVVSMILLYLAGARGLLLLALAFLVSGIASFVLLSRQRDVMSSALMARIRNGRQRAADIRARIEEGARAEDEDLGRCFSAAEGWLFMRPLPYSYRLDERKPCSACGLKPAST
jgi:hypothetical protein